MMSGPRAAIQKLFGSIPEGSLSRKNSLATSHCHIFPRYRVTSIMMCSCSSCLQLRGGDGAVGDAGGEPVGQLVVPQQRVAADELPVRPREGDELVGLRPVVAALGGLDDLPLHPVAGGDHGELAPGDGRVRGRLDVLRDQRGAEAEADPRGQRAQRGGLVILARARPGGQPGGRQATPRRGAGAQHRRGTAGGAHREKTTASHAFPPVASRNISRYSENFGVGLSDNGTVDGSARGVNRRFSCVFQEIMRPSAPFRRSWSTFPRSDRWLDGIRKFRNAGRGLAARCRGGAWPARVVACSSGPLAT